MADSIRTPAAAPFPEGPRPKLLDQVRHTIRMRHYSRRTEATYVHWIRRFIVFHHKKHPSTLGAAAITAFQSWLATGQRVGSSTQNQALSALLFLYRHVLRIDVGAIEQVPRAKLPHRIPVVLSRSHPVTPAQPYNPHSVGRGGATRLRPTGFIRTEPALGAHADHHAVRMKSYSLARLCPGIA